MVAEIDELNQAGEGLKADLTKSHEREVNLESDKVQLELRMAELEEARDTAERGRIDLEAEIERLKEKLEYEKQPDIAFEKENEQLEKQVSACST